jgi:ESCRT-II complex subunit VPS36
MDRFQPIDVSNSSLGAHLYPSEEVYLLTPGVGLYSGPIKSLPHAAGTVYLTSHRLFYIDDAEPHKHSCFVKLSIIRETQFFAGFLKSSPKVTIGFKPIQEEERNANGVDRDQISESRGSLVNSTNAGSSKPSRKSEDSSQNQDWRLNASVVDASADALPTTSWVCRVCAFSNTFDPGLNQSSTVRCALCGVTSDVKDLKLKKAENATAPAISNSTSISRKVIPSNSVPVAPSDGISCPVCTFSNHPSMLRCEMCDSPLTTAADIAQATASYGRSTPSLLAQATPTRTPSKTPEPPEDKGETYNHVRLSFRKGGDRPFYDTLKTTLKEKRWQRGGEQGTNRTSAAPTTAARRRFAGTQANIDGRSANTVSDDENGGGRASTPSRRVGIEGIMSAVDLQAREDTSDMQDALRDLEALMTRAKKMVDFAEALSAKLNKQESSTQIDDQRNDEAANMIRSSLVRLGLPTPAITSDMAKDEMEYYTQLAKELASLLYAPRKPLIGRGKVLTSPRSDLEQSQLVALSAKIIETETERKEGQGIISLDEVWCIWNRARGVALVAPKDLLAVLPLLGKLTTPTISCKTFQSSGLKVLHTPRFSEANLNFRLCALLRERQQSEQDLRQDDVNLIDSTYYASISTLELAQIEACPLHLMTELLSDIEANLGDIVRDEDYWYLNCFG